MTLGRPSYDDSDMLRKIAVSLFHGDCNSFNKAFRKHALDDRDSNRKRLYNKYVAENWFQRIRDEYVEEKVSSANQRACEAEGRADRAVNHAITSGYSPNDKDPKSIRKYAKMHLEIAEELYNTYGKLSNNGFDCHGGVYFMEDYATQIAPHNEDFLGLAEALANEIATAIHAKVESAWLEADSLVDQLGNEVLASSFRITIDIDPSKPMPKLSTNDFRRRKGGSDLGDHIKIDVIEAPKAHPEILSARGITIINGVTSVSLEKWARFQKAKELKSCDY